MGENAHKSVTLGIHVVAAENTVPWFLWNQIIKVKNIRVSERSL